MTMDYELMEKAVETLHEIIEEVHGIKPREYAIQGSGGVLFLNYSPGKDIELRALRIVQDRGYVAHKIAALEFKPVWRETETGHERIYA